MIIQILFSIIAPAAAGDFNALTTSHAEALRKTEQVVRSVGEAQLKFKRVLAECEASKIMTQAKLLDCAAKFYETHFEMQLNRAPLAETKSAVENLAPEFQPAKMALEKVLRTCEKILEITNDKPKKLSEAFLNSNSIYVKRQFTQAGQTAFAKKRISLYCNGLQSEMDSLARQAAFATNQRLSFALRYRYSVRVNSTLAMAKAVTQACQKNYDTSLLTKSKEQLQKNLSPAAYAIYKSEVCAKMPPRLDLTARACRSLPLTSYAVHWLSQGEGAR